jgi:hypothetical protein
MKKHLAQAALVLTAVPALLVALAACSSDGTDAATPDSTEKASAETTSFDWDVAKAKCMRDAGYDYQDPSRDGEPRPGLVFGGDGEKLMKDSEKCTSQITKKLGERPVSAAEKKQTEELAKRQEKTNDCLRKAGYDIPEAQGGVMTGSRDIPEEAYEKCGGNPNTTIDVSGK